MFRKVVSVALVLCLLLSSSALVLATDSRDLSIRNKSENAALRFTHVGSITVKLNIKSGSAYCTGEVDVYRPNEAVVDVELQKYQNGAWVKVKAWSGGPKDLYVMVSESYPVSRGNTYRVKVVGKAVDANGVVLETVTRYSDEESY